MKRKWNRTEKIILSSAFVAFCIISGVMAWGITAMKSENRGGATFISSEATGESQSLEESSVAESTAPTVSAKKTVTVSEQESKLLGILYEKIKDKDLKDAANVMNNNRKAFKKLYEESLKSTRYLFDGQTFVSEIEGVGMVMIRPDTVFYGEFKNGNPNGAVVALFSTNLDSCPRLDYSSGIWKDGYMEGEGVTAYQYYQGPPSGQNEKVERRGNFEKDMINGAFYYMTTSYPQGTVNTWEMKAEMGVTKITDFWSYDEKKQKYRLASEEDDNHFYSLSQADAKQVRWYNMIPWGE